MILGTERNRYVGNNAIMNINCIRFIDKVLLAGYFENLLSNSAGLVYFLELSFHFRELKVFPAPLN